MCDCQLHLGLPPAGVWDPYFSWKKFSVEQHAGLPVIMTTGQMWLLWWIILGGEPYNCDRLNQNFLQVMMPLLYCMQLVSIDLKHNHSMAFPQLQTPTDYFRSSFLSTSWERPCLTAVCSPDLGPVVQSVVSLTSSLRVISLTVLAGSIYNILIFFDEKMWVAFAMQKLLTFFQQKISAYLCITRCKF